MDIGEPVKRETVEAPGQPREMPQPVSPEEAPTPVELPAVPVPVEAPAFSVVSRWMLWNLQYIEPMVIPYAVTT